MNWFLFAVYPLIGYMCACSEYRLDKDVTMTAIAFWLWPFVILIRFADAAKNSFGLMGEAFQDLALSCARFPGEFIKRRHKE